MSKALRKVEFTSRHVRVAVSANESTRRLSERFRLIKRQIAALQEEAETIVQKTIKVLGLGQYEHLTIYKVKNAIVKEHKRKGYTAVRARLGGSKDL